MVAVERWVWGRRVRSRLADVPVSWRDASIAGVVALIQVAATIAATLGPADRDSIEVYAVALALAGPAALLIRRQFPVAVLVVTSAIALVFMLLGCGDGPTILSVIVATFTAVTSGQRLAAWLVLPALYTTHMSARIQLGDTPTLVEALGVAAWMLVLLIGAEVVRVRMERAREATAAREQEQRRRASDERLRIARELHDVLAHHISLINVQAGVGLHLMDRQPEQARTALDAIEQASREAMGELRSVLDILHRPEEDAPRAPAPSLSQLDDLSRRAAAAGLQVNVEVAGEAATLHSPVEAAAYRVIQESVTNVIRHAAARTATVRLGYSPQHLTIEVRDDGAGMSAEPATRRDGNGIAGMRERVRALGGEFEAGRMPGQGFRVRASLPLGDALLRPGEAP